MSPLRSSSILLLRQQNTKWVRMKFYTGDLTLSGTCDYSAALGGWQIPGTDSNANVAA